MREIFNLAGIPLAGHSCGSHMDKQPISKNGPPKLRTAAYLLAARHIQQDELCLAYYEWMQARNGRNNMMALAAPSRDVCACGPAWRVPAGALRLNRLASSTSPQIAASKPRIHLYLALSAGIIKPNQLRRPPAASRQPLS